MKKIQLIEKEVLRSGDTVRVSEDLDRDYKHLTGISFLDNVGLNSLLFSSSLDGKELFPKNFEVAFLQSNVFVPPNERFFTLKNKEANGNKIELDYKDGGTAVSYPYMLRIYLQLENGLED